MATVTWVNAIIWHNGEPRIDSRYRQYTIIGRRSRYVTHSRGVAYLLRIWFSIVG